MPKYAVPEGRVTLTRVAGDDWNDKKFHGLPGQAICLYSLELIAELTREGFPIFPGALGENFTTEGLEYPLRDEPLPAGPARGLSNVRVDGMAAVTLRRGRLLIVETRAILHA